MSETKQYGINSIFYSLQGEGSNTGTAAVFVRFAGCNLHCPFCDTDFSRCEQMTAEQIVNECARYDCLFVVLTGGEPSLQTDERLISELHKRGFKVAIETNGTHELANGIDWITCSPKEGSNVVLREVSELKVVYVGQDVEKWAKQITAEHYFLQPCSQQNTQEVVQYILKHPHWRLSVQTQKYIGIA